MKDYFGILIRNISVYLEYVDKETRENEIKELNFLLNKYKAHEINQKDLNVFLEMSNNRLRIKIDKLSPNKQVKIIKEISRFDSLNSTKSKDALLKHIENHIKFNHLPKVHRK